MAAVARPSVRIALIAPPLVACMIAAGWIFEPTPASSQNWVGVPKRTQTSSAIGSMVRGRRDPNAQMFVQAEQIQYDYNGERVVAAGAVQIHFGGSVLEADQVIYNQKTKLLTAEGNVRLTEADGTVITAPRLELDEQFRNGFIDSLHVETSDKTRFAANRADVRPGPDGGRLTVFQSGVYTACEPCKDDPQRPPKWQVRSSRIIHDEKAKTIYYEDARFELFGLPIAYFPYFWSPDPTVRKQSGFLFPVYMNGTFYGTGGRARYFWNIAPDYDLLLEPGYLSRQGPIMVAEWRQRMIDGAYTIRAAGVVQQERSAFPAGTAGDRDFRGAIETRGDFRLSKNWFYGWDATLLTENQFPAHYKLTRNYAEAVSQAYLFGRGANSYFDMRAMHIYGLTGADVQKQLPILHPIIDYKYRFAHPIFGGELTYNVNVVSLSRQQADFDPITRAAALSGVCDSTDPLAIKTRADCLLRGIPGTHSRFSTEWQWRRDIVDRYGQIFTPFLWARGDAAQASISSQPSVGNFIGTGEQGLARVMPAVGFDYRYPFISAHAWGTQTIEPRAQVIVRPNESQIGRFPNEDAQSLLYDDANLFAISKFPGYDRVEGGGRANVGLQYTAQFNRGGYFNALFGQSYHLFGANSYNVPDMANTGLNSGLETSRSDYVARATFQPNSTYTFASRFRFDEQTFETRRLELEGRINYDRWSASVTYGKYDSQPAVGLLFPREAILPAATLKLTPNWTIGASALYSIDSARLNTISFSAGYIDECIAISAIYLENFGYRGDIVPNRVILLQISLRTLGDTTFAQTVGGPGSGGSSLLGF